jgi:phosphoribosylformylglycinamidine synthase
MSATCSSTVRPRRGRSFDVLGRGVAALEEANRAMGLALSDDEIRYLCERTIHAPAANPTDTETGHVRQVNSEHCRHKIFNASWEIDGSAKDRSLFQMIKHTHACHPEGTLVAYADNSGVVEGVRDAVFAINPDSRVYRFEDDQIDMLMKVETHNHPTAISPFPGAATGVGGEIRDEGARGRAPKAKPAFPVSWSRTCAFRLRDAVGEGLCGVSETSRHAALHYDGGPDRRRRVRQRVRPPQLCGFFRTYEEETAGRYRAITSRSCWRAAWATSGAAKSRKSRCRRVR